MQITGFEKFSLIDYPGQLVATIFLFGCNFRCGFCHNPELVITDKARNVIPEEKILQFLKERKKYLEGVCITGGEPLINQDLPEFLRKIKDIGYLVKLDTNGSKPDLLKKIIDGGLVDYVAMDIKSDKDNYDLLAGKEVELPNIEKSIKIIINSGLDYEFRTTVIKDSHNRDIMKNIGEWLNEFGKPKKFRIQNFVPRKGKIIDDEFEKAKGLKEEELENLKKSVENYFEHVEIRN